MNDMDELTVEVLAEGLSFPEGPAFDSEGHLWFVELQGGSLVQWSRRGLERAIVGGQPNGLALASPGELWFCDAERNAVRTFSQSTAAAGIAADQALGKPLFAPNDLAFDSAGNCVFTCPGGSWDSPVGYVCCRRPDGRVFEIATGLFFPNGLAFVDGGRSLVIAETQKKRLWKGSWDTMTCEWMGACPWADVGGDTGPDGMALGADGLLYVAIFGGGCIKAVDPRGVTVKVLALPGKDPTNCAFDPSGRLGLVVTESEKGLLLSLPELGPGAPVFQLAGRP